MSWPRRHHSRHQIRELHDVRPFAGLDADDVFEQLLALSDVAEPRHVGSVGPGTDEAGAREGADDVEIIDREASTRSLVGLEPTAARPPTARELHLSAVPSAGRTSVTTASVSWGLGTDGWPRHLSRHVRLFFGSHDELAAIAAGRAWDRLVLEDEIDQLDDDVETAVIPGHLQMPYPSRPLKVELRFQPFETRFSRVDLVLVSRHRHPRRFFDIASLALSAMQEIEVRPTNRDRFRPRKDPTPSGTPGR